MACKPSHGSGKPTGGLGIERGDAPGAVGRVSIERFCRLPDWLYGRERFLSSGMYHRRIDQILRPGDALGVQRR